MEPCLETPTYEAMFKIRCTRLFFSQCIFMRKFSRCNAVCVCDMCNIEKGSDVPQRFSTKAPTVHNTTYRVVLMLIKKSKKYTLELIRSF